jgi:hypothetical protein
LKEALPAAGRSCPHDRQPGRTRTARACRKPARTARAPIASGTDDDFVCGHLLGYASGRSNGYLYGDAEDGDIYLTEPAERERRLEAFVAMFGNAVLPWFAEASEPELIVASRAGDYTNDPVALIEWLASRGRQDLIAAYAQRYLTRQAGAEKL